MADKPDSDYNSDKQENQKEEAGYDKKEHEHFLRVIEAFRSYRYGGIYLLNA